jgi:hypothetical protein
MITMMLLGLSFAPTRAGTGVVNLPEWLEPRGLSIVELVGQVPENTLQGMIISYGDNNGIIVYESGTRSRNTVVVTTTIYPRFTTPWWAPNQMMTSFGCLGQIPHYDHVGSVVPASRLRVYDNHGTDVTQQIRYMYTTHMDTRQPSANSREYNRYLPVDVYGTDGGYPLPLGPEGLDIPTNSGCNIQLPGKNYDALTGVFTLTIDAPVSASVLGSQSATFQSYIGVGSVGIFGPLMSQLRARYADRDTRIPLSIPAGADYFLLKYPPMPGDAYADQQFGPPFHNAARPSGGTYRLARPISQNILSTNYNLSAALPLNLFWRDADQVPGSSFLPVIYEPIELAAPEYILPVGVPYDDCFVWGNCSPAKLEQIHDATMPLEIIYLSVDRSTPGAQWTPLRMAGPQWSANALSTSSPLPDLSARSVPLGAAPIPVAEPPTTTHFLFLPIVTKIEVELSGCPCGWFDAIGRMLDYVP